MMTLDYLIKGVYTRQMHLVIASDYSAALVTQTTTYPTGHTYMCLVSMGADDFEKTRPLLDDVEAWAKGMGCLGLEIYGRAGWDKKLEGYKKVTTVLRKTFPLPNTPEDNSPDGNTTTSESS